MIGMNRRGMNSASAMAAQAALDDNSWKGVNEGAPHLSNANNANAINPDGVSQSGFPQNSIPFNSSGTQYSQAGQSSPAGNQSMVFQNSNQPGSNTPQYTSSPAPSGSSTPGPVGQQGLGNNYVQSAGSANFNGPVGGPFGSPSSGLSQFNRPASSGTPFNSGHSGHYPSQSVFGVGQFNALPPTAPFGHGTHPMMGASQQLDRLDQGFRRHNTYFSHTEHRVFELNKRLQQRTEESDNCWWDSFTTEFFEDDARLTILFCLEDGPKRYTIGRTLIPRFFRSIYEGGVSDLYFQLKHAKESFHNTSITLDCDQCTVITQHGKPFFTKVCADARLILEFIYDDYMRIKSWHMTIKGHRELIPRSVIGSSLPPDPMLLDQITKNITRAGITNSTLNYLRLCVILEPMQELMSRHKAYALSPRDCLKTTLFQKWQRMVAPPGKKDPQRPANKRRKRKGSNSGGGANPGAQNVTNQKRSPSGPNFSLSSQDVMVVGEPTLMGGEFGEEDERLITRLENTQYDGSNAVEHDNHPGFGHADSPISGSNPWNLDRTGNIASSPGNGVVPQNNANLSEIDKKSPIVSQ
ncbi:LIM domain-binding protein 2-like [Teleopsis dalmanni]|uniref:LIM domain-binding protein 2-like n=1 Tax=Teleopsis dalmanni TaxID=139649 RepID=UPI000D32B496|nr:LIM domain-binding protein 2-like [Teleopsis dalmanni]XP_037950633.1 LIM domain-binding protein 2-like [Teleopsis dalmanni]XP_037950635.1 LIM domain-binding protein 2-like [Teleopsis dalmanni]